VKKITIMFINIYRSWEVLDPDAWEMTNNPYMILENVSQERLEEAAGDEVVKSELKAVLERRNKSLTETSWFDKNYGQSLPGTVAYFSMEFGLSEALPIYSGGAWSTCRRLFKDCQRPGGSCGGCGPPLPAGLLSSDTGL
jgi:glucan phosphorylase